jgi:hypothetical protein
MAPYIGLTVPKIERVITFNCPRCPRELIYVTSTASQPNGELDTHYYRCPEHECWKFLPSGKIVPYAFTN